MDLSAADSQRTQRRRGRKAQAEMHEWQRGRVSVQRAAKLVGCAESTIRSWIHKFPGRLDVVEGNWRGGMGARGEPATGRERWILVESLRAFAEERGYHIWHSEWEPGGAEDIKVARVDINENFDALLKRIAELEERMRQLAEDVRATRQSAPTTPLAPIERPEPRQLHPTQPLGPQRLGQAQGQGIISWRDWAVIHGLKPGTIEEYVKGRPDRGRPANIRRIGKLDIDREGQRKLWERYNGYAGFMSCSLCPHDKV